MTTVTAVVQATSPPYVIVTVAGIADMFNAVSVFRIVDGVQTPVRGGSDLAPGTIVLTDLEAPFGVEVVYLARQNNVETESAPVTLTVSSPWLSHPITGEAVAVTVQDWSERSYAARRSVIPVSGRRAPVVVSDVRLAPSSSPVLLTRTREQLQALRALLETGDVLLLRAKCDAVEPDWIAVGDASEQRVKPNSRAIDPKPAGSDWRRLWSLDVQHVDQPFPLVPALVNTLADLNNYVPTTLQALHNTFPTPQTLLTIAQTNLDTA